MRSLPHPPMLPVVGSLFELDGNALIQTLKAMSDAHGPIFEITVLGRSTIVLGGQQYVAEVCDEARFEKLVHQSLVNLRPATGDGLFTAHNHEPNWEIAHRILMPAFGPLGIRDMFGKMLDIARQMFDRWQRFGADEVIDVSDSMTRLTLDTLALCAFDYRFNSFYRDDMHPFVDAMVESLIEASARERRPRFVTRAMVKTKRRFERNVVTMHDLADDLVVDRQKRGVGQCGDLLDAMLAGRDGQGRRLDDENIRYQLVTFLIAGHETTSGLLSFATHLLLEHPEVMNRARSLVDSALGDRDPTIDDMSKLGYIEQILMETLRLWPTAPGFAVTPRMPTTLAGEYPVGPGSDILVLLPALHRDRTVWGDTADEFRPERFADGLAERLPPHSWKPFGNGARACIGRGFAMQEAQLVLAMMLQRFELERTDSSYRLSVAETLTLKPADLLVRARRRPEFVASPPVAASKPAERRSPSFPVTTEPGRLLVLHGGNSGTSESFARTIAARAIDRRIAVTMGTLDEHAETLPTDHPVIIVTASYEGQPADNARRFVSWVESAPQGTLADVRFAILGCGNRQWARTYQAVPKRLDAALKRAGATRLIARGEINAAGDMTAPFESWAGALWGALGCGDDIAESENLGIELTAPLRGNGITATCLANDLLTHPEIEAGQVKRHIKLSLPAGIAYRAGDHLAVLPRNRAELVARVARRFGIAEDARILVPPEMAAMVAIPAGHPLSVREVLSDFVELGRPATPDQLARLPSLTSCPPERERLTALLDPGRFETMIALKKVSLIQILEQHPTCALRFPAFLAMLPPMLARRYSISSSPLANAGQCTLTYSVLDVPALCGDGSRHLGVASHYLARLDAGDAVSVAHQPSSNGFHLPDDDATPVVMIAAGSGIAPFRGFIEERAIKKAQGEAVGPMLLFFGCRAPDLDLLHADELRAWERQGVVELRIVFSRSSVNGIRYVQDEIGRSAEIIAGLVRDGAHVYLCGDAAALVPAVETALTDVAARALGRGEMATRRWLRYRMIHAGRYAVDAFA